MLGSFCPVTTVAGMQVGQSVVQGTRMECTGWQNKIATVSSTAPPRTSGIHERFHGFARTARESTLALECSCSASRGALQVSDAGEASTSASTRLIETGPESNGHNGRRTRLLQEGQHKEVDFSKMWSEEARKRIMPGLRVLSTKFSGIAGLIPLHGGLPPVTAFPFTGMQLTLKDGSKLDIADEHEVVAAQQYNLTLKGYGPLLDWVTDHTHQIHNPKGKYDTVIMGGSNYTIEILMRLFMDPGDAMLCEEYTYPHVPESLICPVGYKSFGIHVDEHGIIPSHLLQTLRDMQERGQKLPRLLYTVPVGQNPTGATQTPERKRHIYDICSEFNILILEDDPYYYLQYKMGEAPRGFANLGPSYLSMDTECRVLRLDSFSKLGSIDARCFVGGRKDSVKDLQNLAPGMRISWLTAHPDVTTKVLYHSHGVAMGPCSLSQVVVGSLLTKMGHSGFEDHVRSLQEQYSRRAMLMNAAANQHLAGLADWAVPEAGMFMWLRLRGFQDASEIVDDLEEAGVIVVPGRLARHDGTASPIPCPFVRLSFVVSKEAEIPVAIERLAGLLKRLQGRATQPLPVIATEGKAAAQEETL